MFTSKCPASSSARTTRRPCRCSTIATSRSVRFMRASTENSAARDNPDSRRRGEFPSTGRRPTAFLRAMLAQIPRGRYVAVLGLVLGAVVVRSGIGATYPEDWLMENALVALFLAFLATTYRWLPFSRV